jgi:hypothetical protein
MCEIGTGTYVLNNGNNCRLPVITLDYSNIKRFIHVEISRN